MSELNLILLGVILGSIATSAGFLLYFYFKLHLRYSKLEKSTSNRAGKGKKNAVKGDSDNED